MIGGRKKTSAPKKRPLPDFRIRVREKAGGKGGGRGSNTFIGGGFIREL